MATITLQLLQTPKILLDGNPITLPFKKAEGLLYYMAIKKNISREQAAALFWASNDEPTAKKNLRNTLYTIKKIFQLDLIVSPQKQLLSLNPDLQFDIDYDQFMEQGRTELYQDELLRGFYVKNASEFEDWLSMERTSIKDIYLRKLYGHMVNASSQHISELEDYYSKYIKEDPLDERVYFIMMKAYQRRGLYHKGIKVYQHLSKLLNSELRIAPNKEIKELHRELLNAWTASTASDVLEEQAPIKGRKHEMEYLTKSYHDFISGNPVSIFLAGENGVGKTYLMNHFLDTVDHDSCLVLKTICFQAEKDFLFQPWNAIMLQLDRYITNLGIPVPERYMNAISNLFPLLGNQTPPSHIPEDINISYNYRAIRNSILKLFSLIGEEMPLVLAFDNIQFMDRHSLELLSLVIRDQNPNIFILGTCLDVLKPDIEKYVNSLIRERLTTYYMVNSFSKNDVYLFVKDRLGDSALNDQMLDTIYQETEGNAFFLEILLNNFSKHSFQNVISIRTQDILMDRMMELNMEARQLLDLISLFHDYATLDILENIMNQDTLEILDLLDELKHHALIEEKVADGVIQLRFRHNKMQEFVHSQLSPSKRRLLHNRVAAYLEQSASPRTTNLYQQLIYHFMLSGNNAKVLQYRILNLEAYSSYNFDLYPILHPQMTYTLEEADTIMELFDELITELSQLYHTQPKAIDYSESEARLLLLMGKYYISQGYYQKGVPAINRTLASNEYVAKHPYFHIQLLRQLTFYGIQIWNTDLMEENIQKSMDLARANHLNTDYAIDCRLNGLLHHMKGEPEKARDYLLKSIELFKSAPLKTQSYAINIAACYNYQGEICRTESNFEKSLGYYETAIKTCISVNAPISATFYTNLGRSLLALNRLTESELALETANKIYDDTSTLMGCSITKSYCSMFQARKGNWDKASALLNEAMESAPRLSSPLELGLLAITKATLLKDYPNRFNHLIQETYENCREQAVSYLSNLYGIYEFSYLSQEGRKLF